MLSTLNVQHLESLNDQIAELSGIRVRETIPDAILGRADEIVLVDLTPEALLDRLRAGKVYPARADRRRAEQLLPDREPLRAARGRAPPGRPGGRAPSASPPRASSAHARRRSPRTRPRPSASACSRSSSPILARSDWSAARGARRNALAPSSICCGCGHPDAASPRRGTLAHRAAPARVDPRRAPADRGIRQPARGDRRCRPPAAQHLHPDRTIADRRAESRDCAPRCPSG